MIVYVDSLVVEVVVVVVLGVLIGWGFNPTYTL